MFLSRFAEKLADSTNPFPTFFATAIAEALYGLKNSFRFVTDEIVIDIDDQHCGPLSETGALAVTGKSEDFFIALSQDIIPCRHAFISFMLSVSESKNIAQVIVVNVPKPVMMIDAALMNNL
jgi:hypothetical protein